MNNICGVVGKDLNENSIKSFAKQLVRYIKENKLSHRVLVAEDGRASGDYIVAVLQSVFLKNGIDVDCLGVAPAPCVEYLTDKFKYNLGIMISAPNKESEYNGINVYFAKNEGRGSNNKKYGKSKNVESLGEVYIRKLKNELKCKNKYIFDCGNGACTAVVRKIFPRHKLIGDDTSGEYINDSFGVKHIQTLSNMCKKMQSVGFAFSVDGRGVVAVDECGQVIDSDKIIYILSKFYLSSGGKVSVCENSSVGLNISLRRLGVSVLREQMETDIACDKFGNIATNSKHADGMYIAIKLISILEQSKMTFGELLKDYKQYFVMRGEVNGLKGYNKTSKDLRVVTIRMDENTTQIFVEGLDKNLVEQEFNRVMRELKL